MRRQFQLPQNDVAYLDRLGRPWETIIEGGARWLLLHEWPVPPGYNHQSVYIAVLIEPAYPDGQLDMVYTFPHLARADNMAIPSLSQHTIDGKSFQRWSRHRTAANPWRPGIDDVEAHLLLADSWFAREFLRRAA